MDARTAVVALDQAFFCAVNQRWTCALLDGFFPVLTELHRHILFWLAVVPVAGLYLKSKGREAGALLLGAVLAIGLSDQTNHRLLKPFFHRTRPHRTITAAVVRTPPYSGYSFPSGHASNMGALAAFGILSDPALAPVLVPAAAAVAYSRVYVGVHYPLDALGGLLWGALVGWAVFVLLRALRRRLSVDGDSAGPSPPRSDG